MEAAELVQEIRTLQNNMRRSRNKKKNETKDQYVKRKYGYRCCYCHRKPNKKQLNVAVEPVHIVKRDQTINDIADYYRTTVQKLQILNPESDLYKLTKGDFLHIPKFFKVFPETHGICFCDKCGNERRSLKLNHIDYISFILERRKEIRSEVTPEVKREVFQEDGNRCEYCDIEFGKQKKNPMLTIDHKKPIVKGGTSERKNLTTSCCFHNYDKGKENYDEYLQRIKTRRREREIKNMK